jgi:hypothetical protein
MAKRQLEYAIDELNHEQGKEKKKQTTIFSTGTDEPSKKCDRASLCMACMACMPTLSSTTLSHTEDMFFAIQFVRLFLHGGLSGYPRRAVLLSKLLLSISKWLSRGSGGGRLGMTGR